MPHYIEIKAPCPRINIYTDEPLVGEQQGVCTMSETARRLAAAAIGRGANADDMYAFKRTIVRAEKNGKSHAELTTGQFEPIVAVCRQPIVKEFPAGFIEPAYVMTCEDHLLAFIEASTKMPADYAASEVSANSRGTTHPATHIAD